MNANAMQTRRLIIRGQVQGVGFRYSMVRQARTLGVTGWVRNRPDGSVEAVVNGNPQAVDAMIEWAHRGPPGAIVRDVTVAESDGEYETFETRRD
jgi:acylphosphatase